MKRTAKTTPVTESPLPLQADTSSNKKLDAETIDTMAKAVIARYPRVMAKLAE